MRFTQRVIPLRRIVVSALLIMAGTNAQNLLSNPSFEDNVIKKLTYIRASSFIGWQSLGGESFELWFTSTKVPAADGNNFLELDRRGYGSSGVVDGWYQDVRTVAGQEYRLSFYMRARKGNRANTEHEAAYIEWNGVLSDDNGYHAPSGDWEKKETIVVGTGGMDRLTIRETANPSYNNGVGPFIDMVELQAIEQRVMDTATNGQIGGGGGDPHFKTWSGRRFDYHGECDLVLLNNPNFDNGRGLRIHIRTVRKGYYSFIERAALQIGDDHLEFVGINDWYMNGAKAPATPRQRFAGYKLRVHPKAVSVRIDEKAKVKIDFKHRKNGFLYIDVDGSHSENFLGSLGMIGQWGSGLMIGRDNETVIEDPDDFARDWQVRNFEPQLFQTIRRPQFPSQCYPPKKVLGDRLGCSSMRRKAEVACKERAEELEECVFDVMATRDLRAAVF